jgi:hypothetical protein
MPYRMDKIRIIVREIDYNQECIFILSQVFSIIYILLHQVGQLPRVQ